MKKFFKNLFVGRIGKKNYLLGYLFNLSISLLLSAILYVSIPIFSEYFDPLYSEIIGFGVIIFYYLFFSESLALRRANDFDRKGVTVYTFFGFGSFISAHNLYLAGIEGDKDSNKYGPPPRNDRNFFADIFNF